MIEIKNVSLSLGSKEIFTNLNWHIKSGRKIGLCGPNGTGKTTLLNLITGYVEADSGEVKTPSKTVIGYLPQELKLKSGQLTLLEESLTVFDNLFDLEKEHKTLIEAISAISGIRDENDPVFIASTNRINAIESELKAHDFDLIRSRTEKMLMGLGFSTLDFNRPLSNFSGGWRMRVELAKLLLINPDLLLLDEPTNHLDIESIEWLEKYLKTFESTVVVVSHDKYFLDRMVDSIADLGRGKITEYTGNYSSYLEQRESRISNQVSAYENQQRLIKQYERFIERFRYKNTKASQVQSRIKMLDKMEKIDQVETDKAVSFRFPETVRSGKIVMSLSAFSKTYQNDNIIFDHSGPLAIKRGDKIALIGKNGIGKSTLIRIINGSEEFDGVRKPGHAVETAYFAQNQAEYLDTEKTIIDEMLSSTDTRVHNETVIRSILGSFLFSGDDVYKKIKVLSGGEKSRVALAKCLLSPKNFLILDEPTNHLDIQSRTVLIEALKQYSGTYIIVSHDRYFLDQVCNSVWFITDRKVHSYSGNYSEYLSYKENSNPETLHKEDISDFQRKSVSEDNYNSKSIKRQEAERRNKYFNMLKEKGIENFNDWEYLTKNQLCNAITELESLIETREAQKSEIEQTLAKQDIYINIDESRNLSLELENINSNLNTLYEKWDNISTLIQN